MIPTNQKHYFASQDMLNIGAHIDQIFHRMINYNQNKKKSNFNLYNKISEETLQYIKKLICIGEQSEDWKYSQHTQSRLSILGDGLGAFRDSVSGEFSRKNELDS
jgi:hypothetical protein